MATPRSIGCRGTSTPSHFGRAIHLGDLSPATASSIALVTPGIRTAFLDCLRAKTPRFTTDDPLDLGVRSGPLVSTTYRDKVEAYLELGKAAGYRTTSGPPPGSSRAGYFVVPHLFESVEAGTPLATEEIFGPVLATLDVSDLDTALKIANQSPFGLSAGICTHSLAAAQKFKRQVEAGIVTVNLSTAGSKPTYPSGALRNRVTVREKSPAMQLDSLRGHRQRPGRSR